MSRSNRKKKLPNYVEDSPYKLSFGFLDPKVSDEEIRQVLEIVGELSALNIIRTPGERVYGYFTYAEPSLTTKAIKVCDGLEVGDDSIHVWKQSPPEDKMKRGSDGNDDKKSSKKQRTDKFSSAPAILAVADQLSEIMQRDAPNKQARELYVGNVPDQYDPEELRAFLGEAMQQSGLALYPGNPILNLRINQKFCFLEVRTVEEATRALNMTNIIYKGCSLQFGRTKTYTGTTTTHKTWDEVRGKCTLGVADTVEAKYDSIIQALRPISTELSTATNMAKSQYPKMLTPYLQINNITTLDQVQDGDYLKWLEQDIRGELEKYGKVEELIIPTQKDAGKIFVRYEKELQAAKFFSIVPTLSYCGRLIGAVFISAQRFGLFKERNK